MLKAWNFTKNEICYRCFDNNLQKLFRTNPANISCFPRRLQDVFSVTLFVFQDVLKASWRRLQDIFAKRLPKTSSRRFQDVFKTSSKTCLQDVLQLCLQDVFKTSWKTKNVTLKTSSRCLQDVFSTSSPRPMFPGLLRVELIYI